MTIRQQGGVFGRNPSFNDVTVDGDAVFPDGSKAIFGTGADLQIYHDGLNSYIDDQGTGRIIIKGNDDVRIRSGSNEEMIVAAANGATTLYFDSFPKIATASTGVSITGNVIVASGNGIDFSATSGTGTSELFDDYEEGTWTPTFGNLTLGDGVSTGTYTKIGDTVTIYGKLVLGSTTTVDGILSVTNLPYTAASAFNSGGLLRMVDQGTATYLGMVSINASSITLRPMLTNASFASSGSVSATGPFTWTATDILEFNAVYKAA